MRLREEADERISVEVLSFESVDFAREDFCLGAAEVLGFGTEVPFAESETADFDKVSFFIDDSTLEVDSRKYK